MFIIVIFSVVQWEAWCLPCLLQSYKGRCSNIHRRYWFKCKVFSSCHDHKLKGGPFCRNFFRLQQYLWMWGTVNVSCCPIVFPFPQADPRMAPTFLLPTSSWPSPWCLLGPWVMVGLAEKGSWPPQSLLLPFQKVLPSVCPGMFCPSV